MLSEWPLYAISAFGAMSVWLGFRIGQYNLATVVYMAAGGYTAAVLASAEIQMHWAGVIAMALLIAAVLGIAMGLVALRVHGFTYALLTVAVVEMVLASIVQVDALGAARGLLDPDVVDNSVIVAAGSLGALLLVAILAVDFRQFGLRMRIFELGSARLGSLGQSPVLFSLQVNVIMAVLGALGGLITYKYTHYIQPAQFDLTTQIELLTFVIVGGVASPVGPVAIALVLTYIGQQFDTIGDWRDIAMAAILLVFMLIRAQGLVGNLRAVVRLRLRGLALNPRMRKETFVPEPQSVARGGQDADAR